MRVFPSHNDRPTGAFRPCSGRTLRPKRRCKGFKIIVKRNHIAVGLLAALAAVSSISCASKGNDEERDVAIDTGSFDVKTGDNFECFYTGTIADTDWNVARAVATQGIGGHHVTVYWTDQVQPASHHTCTDDEMLTWHMVSGAGGEDGASVEGLVRLPDGYVSKVPKGGQIVVQAHYINGDSAPRTVRDLAKLHLVPDSKVIAYANIYAVNDGSFTIPAHGGTYHTTTCRTERDLSVLIMLGHMHEHGKHYRLDRIDEHDQVIENMYDTDWVPYYVSHPPTQRFDPSAPLTIAKGTRLRQTCSWQNESASSLQFPREMCTGVIYYFPDVGGGQLDCPPDVPESDAGPVGDGGANCVAVGDPGNELGVGSYCDDQNSCKRRQGGPILICTGAQAGPGQSFCTTFCSADTDCGIGAYCMIDPRGNGCVPAACGGVPGGGADAGQ